MINKVDKSVTIVNALGVNALVIVDANILKIQNTEVLV